MSGKKKWEMAFVIAALLVTTACWLLFPLLYEVARRFEAAHAATDSEGGVIFWGLAGMVASGGFISGQLLALGLAACAMMARRDMQLRQRRAVMIALAGPALSIIAHLVVDY